MKLHEKTYINPIAVLSFRFKPDDIGMALSRSGIVGELGLLLASTPFLPFGFDQ